MGSKRLTIDSFIERASVKYNNKYDYSKVSFTCGLDKVIIRCPVHGDFTQQVYYHVNIGGCRRCGIEKRASLHSKGIVKFIEEASKKYNGKYDYSKFIYTNNKNKSIITCPFHGDFLMKPENHLNGNECPECKRVKYNQNEAIEKCFNMHGNKYDYSKFIYINSTTKSIIICKKHGEFMQTPAHHWNGNGCPICKESKGENLVRNILIKKNIKYITQHKFKDCRGKRHLLPFDFYLPDLNVVIEYQGRQHYNKTGTWESAFEKTILTDKIKKEYCMNNNINLLEIPYYEKNVENIILVSLKI